MRNIISLVIKIKKKSKKGGSMKKIILKEFEKCYLIIDIVFYNIICIIGLIVLSTDGLDLISLIKYFYLLFFVIAFFATLAYFSNRRKGDYEFLLYAFINVYVGTFALVYINYNNPWLILGCSMLVYTIANSLNRAAIRYVLPAPKLP